MRALNALTATTGNRTDCWNTPQHVLADVYDFFPNLELDPCCNDKAVSNVIAQRYYDESDDGLSEPWNADTVFMNHPYSNSKEWIPYAVQQHELHNNEMLLLIKLDVSTKWWRSVAKYPWLAYNKRLKFGNGKGAAPFQSAMIYLGHRVEQFHNVFSKDGFIYSTTF
jgi:phage N-6-adenine-methyltransferase